MEGYISNFGLIPIVKEGEIIYEGDGTWSPVIHGTGKYTRFKCNAGEKYTIVEANASTVEKDENDVYFPTLIFITNTDNHIMKVVSDSLKNYEFVIPENIKEVIVNSYSGNLVVYSGSLLHAVVQNELLSIMKKQESEEE